MNEESLFAAALEMASTAERQAFLDEACAGDLRLRQRVGQLLAADGRARGILDADPDATALLVDLGADPPLEAGRPFAGRFRLVRKLGEGGMGEVWVADQIEPVQRQVALKVIRPGLDSARLAARFDQERQALALMDHPNIAKVLDAGVTAGEPGGVSPGRPYFVMELIPGVPITRYCDEANLSLRQRLELFVPVCHAVQHAHQKGVIHRDLKPSNILVATYDGQPVPKVIDFGVAKATGPRLADHTVSTEVGTLVGTLEYMSPEQAELNSPDADTRSDIYSLGVVLYELLTGGVPFPRERLQAVPFTEMLRIIKEDEPQKPSARLAGAETLPGVAAVRHTEPRRLTALVRGELDWIVMKCLEKERARRYETASALALDLQRYLADEPVLAGPPAAGYRLRKFLRRRQGPVLAAGLVLLALLGGIVGTTIGLVRAERARQAEAERADGERLAKETAEKRLVQIEKGIDLLSSIFENLDPRAEEKEGRPLRAILGDRLDQAAAALEGEVVGDPLVVAGLQNRLGLSLLHLGHPDRAITLFTRAGVTYSSLLDPNHPDALTCLSHLAVAYKADRQMDKALPLFEETFRLRKAVLGPDARPTLVSMNNLAAAYRQVGRLAEAIPLHEEALELRKATLGADSSDTLVSMNDLAWAYYDARKLDQAVELWEEALKLTSARRAPVNYHTLQMMNNLAMAYSAAHRLGDALPLLEKSLPLARAHLAPDHPFTLLCIHNLGGGYLDAGRLDEALPFLQQAAEGIEKRQFRHEYDSQFVNSLIFCHERLKQFAQAEEWRRKWMAVVKERAGADSLPYASELAALGLNLLHQKKWTEAEAVLRDCLAIRETKAPDSSTPFNTKSMLGAALVGQQKYDEAEPLLLQGYEGLRQREAKLPPQAKDQRLREALERLVRLYDAWGKPDEAAKWRQELGTLSKPAEQKK